MSMRLTGRRWQRPVSSIFLRGCNGHNQRQRQYFRDLPGAGRLRMGGQQRQSPPVRALSFGVGDAHYSNRHHHDGAHASVGHSQKLQRSVLQVIGRQRADFTTESTPLTAPVLNTSRYLPRFRWLTATVSLSRHHHRQPAAFLYAERLTLPNDCPPGLQCHSNLLGSRIVSAVTQRTLRTGASLNTHRMDRGSSSTRRCS